MAEPITVSYFAAFVEHTGCSREELEVDERTVGALRRAVADKHGPVAGELARVSAVLDSDRLVTKDVAGIGTEVDLLPPFAGG